MHPSPSYQALESLPPPYKEELGLPYELVLTSEARNWQNLQLTIYKTSAQPEPITLCCKTTHKLQMVLEGSGDMTCYLNARAQHRKIQSGSLSLIPCGMRAAYQWTHSCVLAEFSFSPHLLQTLVTPVGQDDPAGHCLMPQAFFRDSLIEQLAKALLTELESEALVASNLYANTLAQTLGLHLLKHYSTLTPTATLLSGGLSQEQLRRVTDCIEDCLATDISLEHLAFLTGLSPLSFTKKFKQTTGLPPHRYLIFRRVEKAKDLLKQPLSIAEVSQRVGFFDQSHLSRHFKYWVGVSPKDYRHSLMI